MTHPLNPAPFQEQRLRYPSRVESLNDLYPVLRCWTQEVGLNADESHRWLVAITEIFTNAVVHGNREDSDKEVEIVLRRDPDFLEAVIVDSGLGLPPKPRETAPGDATQTGGRGLQLARKFADEVSMEETPGGGLTVRLRLNVSRSERCETREAQNKDELQNSRWRCDMELRVTTHQDVDVLSVSGRLDLVSSNSLKDEIRKRLQERRTRLILNLAGVDFINSSGLGALVSVLKDVRLVNGRLVLSNLAPYVQEIFEITQLSNVFEIFATEESARAVFEMETQSVAR